MRNKGWRKIVMEIWNMLRTIPRLSWVFLSNVSNEKNRESFILLTWVITKIVNKKDCWYRELFDLIRFLFLENFDFGEFFLHVKFKRWYNILKKESLFDLSQKAKEIDTSLQKKFLRHTIHYRRTIINYIWNIKLQVFELHFGTKFGNITK